MTRESGALFRLLVRGDSLHFWSWNWLDYDLRSVIWAGLSKLASLKTVMEYLLLFYFAEHKRGRESAGEQGRRQSKA